MMEQLRREWVVHTMIDTLVRLLPQAEGQLPDGLTAPYTLITPHRSSNVDDPAFLAKILEVLEALSRELPIVFPIHPRTRKRMVDLLGGVQPSSVWLIDPVGYLDFLLLQKKAAVVITDSGGVQEETTYLGVPCLTLRSNTERPATVEMGTNQLIGQDTERLRVKVLRILEGQTKRGQIPPLWDRHAAERIAEIITAR
jgi:UDP-N-acetylglucosamine 2-epimerase (non-hydrolysing)